MNLCDLDFMVFKKRIRIFLINLKYYLRGHTFITLDNQSQLTWAEMDKIFMF